MKKLINRVLSCLAILAISVCLTTEIYGQKIDKKDSTVVVKHSPRKATLLALVPGLGQIYNKKYWKLPIVYAGFAATGYFAIWNRGEYLKYNNAYIANINNTNNILVVRYDPEKGVYVSNLNERLTENELADKYDSDQLQSFRDYYRRNMELSFILMGVWYILQILDATVDAHLYYWEVNENLSVKVEPVFQQSITPTPLMLPHNNINHNGLKLTVKF
ncbi:MAG TPA: DUF5683 domain-containing protein [Bacteroidales bacterium]|nr:DUF5683 domain-containing protein [Bacteroidales bacterium]